MPRELIGKDQRPATGRKAPNRALKQTVPDQRPIEPKAHANPSLVLKYPRRRPRQNARGPSVKRESPSSSVGWVLTHLSPKKRGGRRITQAPFEALPKIVRADRFGLNVAKTRAMPSQTRQVVTDIVVNAKTYVVRRNYDWLKAVIHAGHRLITGQEAHPCQPSSECRTCH